MISPAFNKSLILFIIIMLCFCEKLSAQSPEDSLWTATEAESELYEINLMKFKRLLRYNKTGLIDSTFRINLENITHQFTELAQQDNFRDANLILESTIDLFLKQAMRILGPWRSANIATSRPIFFAILRTVPMRCFCSSLVP